MKVNLDEPIRGFDGEPVEDRYIENNGVENITRPTIGSVICNAMSSISQETDSGDQLFKKFTIGLKCAGKGEVDLSVDERALIKTTMVKHKFSAIAYGRICELFEEPKEEKPAKKGKN